MFLVQLPDGLVWEFRRHPMDRHLAKCSWKKSIGRALRAPRTSWPFPAHRKLNLPPFIVVSVKSTNHGIGRGPQRVKPSSAERPKPTMKFSLSITKPEITELSKRSGVPIPRELQLQFETRETVVLLSDLELSNMTQFQLAKAVLSALPALGTALTYGELA